MSNTIKKINALYDENIIRVYQAFNKQIADEVLKFGKFGPSFKRGRMTWIKPSFLWMMYRSGWGLKENQERILAIDITKEGFDTILKNVILSTYQPDIYESFEFWKEKLKNSEVRCQWDPDRDIYGNPINRRAIQLGIQGTFIERYINEWIVNITDITDVISKWREEIKNGRFDKSFLPVEKEYPVSIEIQKVIGL